MPLTSVALALSKVFFIACLLASSAFWICVLTTFTARSCGMNHDALTLGLPTVAGVIACVEVSRTKVTNCVNETDPFGDHHLLPDASTVPEIAIPPFSNVSVGPEVKLKW